MKKLLLTMLLAIRCNASELPVLPAENDIEEVVPYCESTDVEGLEQCIGRLHGQFYKSREIIGAFHEGPLRCESLCFLAAEACLCGNLLDRLPVDFLKDDVQKDMMRYQNAIKKFFNSSNAIVLISSIKNYAMDHSKQVQQLKTLKRCYRLVDLRTWSWTISSLASYYSSSIFPLDKSSYAATICGPIVCDLTHNPVVTKDSYGNLIWANVFLAADPDWYRKCYANVKSLLERDPALKEKLVKQSVCYCIPKTEEFKALFGKPEEEQS